MYVFKLCSGCYNHFKFLPVSRNQFASSLRITLRGIVSHDNLVTDSDEVSDVLNTKVIYNSRIRYYYNKKGSFSSEKYISRKPSDIPIALKVLGYTTENVESRSQRQETNEDQIDSNLPFKYSYKPNIIQDRSIDNTDDEPVKEQVFYTPSEIRKSRKWMTDYEYYKVEPDKKEGDTSIMDEWTINYGTPNTAIPISNVPCGGCGARMQCREPSIPGYLPSEIFLECRPDDLKELLCQRCHFLKNYNTALSVQVDPSSYEELIKQMKDNSLVLLLVDLTDFPCSIWPGIVDIIGRNRPIFVVGNKVDLLWGDRKHWLKHVENLLRNQFPSYANILDVSLISAKTGFGVENLITKLHTIWKYQGSVYVIGCTNVGKSTLFNALLASDLCRSKAIDLIQRATTAPWPKTTLNLLKFPILRPEGWKLHLRDQRLSADRLRAKAEAELRKTQFSKKKNKITPVTLIGHIAHTFRQSNLDTKDDDTFVLSKSLTSSMKVPSSVMENDFPEYKNSHWFYDTPGVLHEDQILDLLTTEELIMTIPKSIIRPVSYRMMVGWSIFLGGLARLDFLEGTSSAKVVTFCSEHLPVTICKTCYADDVYTTLLHSNKYFGVPYGPPARFKQWPGLTCGQEFSVCGIDENESCADVLLSSAGWVALTPKSKEICKFVGWTPQGRGIHVRHPSLLPFAVRLRGRKMRHTPLYDTTRVFIPS